MVVVPSPPATLFQCPGERHPIPRSVHLARLGRSYAACANCPQRYDSGLVPLDELTLPEATDRECRNGVALISSGVRGRYLNDLDRVQARRLAAAFARFLWEGRPWQGRKSTESERAADVSASAVGTGSSALRRALTVVVGYDERPSSPDLAIGVVTGCVQAGCRVVDVGLVSRAMWTWAARHHQADGAVLITGVGRETSWTGCDFLGPNQRPLSSTQLERMRQESKQDSGRPTRTSGSVAAFPLIDEYVSELRCGFHALRPLHVLVVTASEIVGHAIRRVFAELPCTLDCETGREWHAVQLEESGVEGRIQQKIVEGEADVAFWIDEDGQRLSVFASQGDCVNLRSLASRLAQMLAHESSESVSPLLVVTAPQVEAAVQHGRESIEIERGTTSTRLPVWMDTPVALRHCEGSDHAEFQKILSSDLAGVGLDDRERLWLADPQLQCDAIATVAATLRLMSWTDSTLSELIGETRSAIRT